MYGGSILSHLLTVIINSINRIEPVQLQIRRGIIVYIDKSGKNPIYKDNNRSITLGPVIDKVGENVLMLKYSY